MLGGIGTFELVLILLIILMVFGAGKLPQVMKMLGSGVRSFKSSMSGEDEEEKDPELLEDTKTREEPMAERERQADSVQ